MTDYPVPQRSIWFCERDHNGRKNSCQFRCYKNALSRDKRIKPGEDKPTPHWFIVISKKVTHGFVTALPATSQKYQKEYNDGETISQDDIEESPTSKRIPWQITKQTLVLCNMPCRIPIEDLNETNDCGKLKKERYDYVLTAFKLCFNQR
jgi:hypothetical protein